MSRSRKKDTSKRLVSDVVWFKEEISGRFGITITADEVGYEAVALGHDEIDENIISKEELGFLPNPLLAQTFMYTHSNEDEWLLIIVNHEHDGSMLYQTWLKNNQKVYSTGRW
ncbi:MAG TPA: hypothetical protein VK067_09280 [Pseudogracilibacillus sp.]|nr:hypothetical protein [Pseudogracilibacillus sp.]